MNVKVLRNWRALLAPTVMTLVIGGLAGCQDDIIVVERPAFDDPADTVNAFLGYSDVEAQLTACGSCHAGKQSGWATTGHKHAWDGLQSSGSAQDFCEGCHTVSNLGNTVPVDEPAGYNLVASDTYEDVQCESCHGPGGGHLDDPDGVKPLAHLGVGLETGCGACHNDTHHPFVEQWAASRHGTVPAQAGYAGQSDSCRPCHEGKTALAVKMLETGDYLERDDGENLPLTCAVCHDPHGSNNPANLRRPIDTPTLDNLCVSCHSRVGTPPSSHGPHAAQGLLVLGINVGWQPPGFRFDTLQIIGTHGSEANPRLCATCHVEFFSVTNEETGDFEFESVGHLFEPIPCIDSEGLPTIGDCALSERRFDACATSGCHGTPDVARGLYTSITIELNFFLDQLWEDANDDHVIDVTDSGLLPLVVAQGDTLELDPTDDLVTTAEGALWNAQLAFTNERPYFGDGEVFGKHFSAHKASGNGVHNPFLLRSLLIGSIDAVSDEYGLAPSPAYIARRAQAQR